MKSNVYKENYEAKKTIDQMKSDFEDILTIIYCIGGPLNDNVLNYTKEQMVTFFRIAEIAKCWRTPNDQV